jgi:Glycosyltransferase
MKITFIVDQFPVLSETFIINQVIGLIDKGVEIEIFSCGRSSEYKIHEAIFMYKLLEKTIFFEDIVPKNRLQRLINGLKILLKFQMKPKVLLNALNIFEFGKRALSFELLLLADHFKNDDVLLCHFGPNGIMGARLKKLGIKAKIITIFHGYDMTTFIEQKGPGVYSELFKYGDLFLPICNKWKERLIDLGCDKNKIKVHHMGIDIEEFKHCGNSNLSAEPIVFISVGRLHYKKGHEYAIKAMAKIVKKYSNVKYLIVGEGPLRSELESLVKDLGLENIIEFTGAATQKEIVGFYEKSHIFILPSISEGLPVVLMEAQAMGLPVIASNVGGVSEIVADGKSGFLVPPKDVDSLTNKIKFLLQNKVMWKKMGEMGQKIIQNGFNIKRLSRELECILGCLLKIKGVKV